MPPEETSVAVSPAQARIHLQPYTAEIKLPSIGVGVDNIHFDVFLSPKFIEFARRYLLDLIRQTANINLDYGGSHVGDPRNKKKSSGAPQNSAFRKMLADLLQASLTRAKSLQNIEIDLLYQLAILDFLRTEISQQFSSLLVECKEWIRSRGELFEHSERAHLMRSKISDLQANRKAVYRQVGEIVHRVWKDFEDSTLAKSRRALFGEDFAASYELLKNPFLFVESGSDDLLYLEQYILLGNFIHDPDRFEIFEALLIDFVRDFVLVDENAEELGKARKAHDRVVEQARNLRSEIARLEQEQEELAGISKDDLFPRLWKRRGGAESGHEARELAHRQKSLEGSIEELGPQIEAARQRMEFLRSEHQNRLGDYVSEPSNATRLFDPRANGEEGLASRQTRERLLQEWVNRLEERDLLIHVLAGYELRNIYKEYCPPVHLQQLKKSLVVREEAKRVEQIVEQFPARKFSLKKLEEATKAIRRQSSDQVREIALRFAEDLMRMRRDRRNYQHVAMWMEKIHLVRSEHTRQLSRENKSLNELLLSDEEKPKEDPIVSHAVIKADVRGSTGITKDLLARGLNPASHFSMALHEPVKRILDRYGAAKVFIEGDAIILAIYETESTRVTQRAVAKACVLAREILAVVQAYNEKTASSGLPPLELGVGVAFQNSAPAVWMDGDFKIMISRALNLSDRLSSCAKMARRLFAQNPSPFNVFLLQSLMDDANQDEGEELVIRFNLNGIELNEEGFQKLGTEISLAPMSGNFPMPWGKQKVQLYFGEAPIGGSFEPLVIRKGSVRQLLSGGKIGEPGARSYYEVCTHPKLLELARKKIAETATKT